MVIQHRPPEASRASARQARKSDTGQPRPAKPPLTSEESELLARLSPLLARQPRRGHRANEGSTPPPLPEVDLAHTLSLPTEPLLPPLPVLFDTASEPLPPGETTVRTVTWLLRSRRARLRNALRYAFAWIVTLAVVAGTIAIASVSLLGTERSGAIVREAGAELASGLEFIHSAIARQIKR
jgi:hypothetical protein